MKVIQIQKFGGPEVLELKDIEIGKPGPKEVLIKNLSIAINYIDVYHRTGLYPIPLPSGIGFIASGNITKTLSFAFLRLTSSFIVSTVPPSSTIIQSSLSKHNFVPINTLSAFLAAKYLILPKIPDNIIPSHKLVWFATINKGLSDLQ